MAKPAYKRALQSNFDDFGKKTEVLLPNEMWTVTYQFQPIVICTQNEFDIGKKYRRTTFAQKGSAVNLAKSLNKQFETTDFDVKQI